MPPAIELGQQPSHHEARAAEELRRYWYQLTGEVIGTSAADGQRILIGVIGGSKAFLWYGRHRGRQARRLPAAVLAQDIEEGVSGLDS